MPTVSVDDTALYYRTSGSGYPCVLMHGGFGMDHSYFHPWVDPLGDLFEFVSYDHRCNGRSARPPIETFTFLQLCADADALRAALGFERIAVLGHSAGGFVALEYTLRYPERVSHLILVGTAPAFDYTAEIGGNAVRKGATPQMLAVLAAPAPTADAAAARAFESVMPLYFHAFDEALAARAFGAIRWSAAAYGCNERLFPTYDVLPRLHELHMPALVVVGDDDFICPPSQAERLHAALGDSTLATIEDCGHFPFIEQPEAFRGVVRAWWKDARERPSRSP
jgi:proline iminopeptidase